VPSESSFINEMRLREGIEELEGLAESRNTVVLHDAKLCELIQQHLGVEVYYFQFSATSLKGIFSAIRSEAIERLNRLPQLPPLERARSRSRGMKSYSFGQTFTASVSTCVLSGER
jgi:hypothetical protein